MIAECVVLLRIKHFYQRRRWIAAEVASEFVNFVQHHHWIVHLRAFDALNNLSRQRADVRAPVSADFRFIVHATQGDTHEFASQRTSNRLAQLGLAYAWGPNEA